MNTSGFLTKINSKNEEYEDIYCEVILLFLNKHMFCVYLIAVGQLRDGNMLFYFTFCLKGKLMYV